MDVALLEKSFEQISPRAIEFSASFYRNLFRHHPELKPLFAETSQAIQEKKLIFSLAAIIENLRNPDILQPALKSLGARHAEVGTIKSHYPFVGQALIETFAEYLAADWTEQLATAWVEAYNVIASTMIEGARNPAAYLEPELTFYEWIDLYGEESPKVRKAIASLTHYHYGQQRQSEMKPTS